MAPIDHFHDFETTFQWSYNVNPVENIAQNHYEFNSEWCTTPCDNNSGSTDVLIGSAQYSMWLQGNTKLAKSYLVV